VRSICESYLSVNQKVKDMESDQEFFSDIYSVTMVAIKSTIYRWPNHIVLAQRISEMKRKRLGCIELRMLFPNMHPGTLSSIVNHYRGFEPIRRITRHVIADDQAAVMMKQISSMLGTPLPSLHEALSTSAALQREGFHQSQHKSKQKEAALEAMVQQQVPACPTLSKPPGYQD